MIARFRIRARELIYNIATTSLCDHSNAYERHGELGVALIAALACFLALVAVSVVGAVIFCIGWVLYDLGKWAVIGGSVVVIWVGTFLLLGRKTKKMEAWEVIRDRTNEV